MSWADRQGFNRRRPPGACTATVWRSVSPCGAYGVTDRPEMIVVARAAADDGRWLDAYTVFAEVDQASPLDAGELELLASAATFSGRPDEASAARQRAFSLVRTY